MTYDEIKLAALIQVSCFVKPINSGSRHNKAVADNNTIDIEAVYIGAVGPRFEKPGFMEWQEIIEDTESNKIITEIFASFYDKMIEDSVLPNETTITLQSNKKFLNGKKFKTALYQLRIAISAETFLLEANERGKLKNTEVHVVIVGLGLGHWQAYDTQVCFILYFL